MAPRPYLQPVPAGRHEVTGYLVRDRFSWLKVAAAAIRFQDAPVVRMELALVDGQDVGSLGPGEFFGYGVDAGTGCFADPAALQAWFVQVGVTDLDAFRDGPGPSAPPEQFATLLDRVGGVFDAVDDQMVAQLTADGEGGDLTAVVPGISPGSTGAVAFSSGWGDGACPSWFGFDADGDPVLLLTDFGLLGLDDLDGGPIESEGRRQRPELILRQHAGAAGG